MHDVREIAGRHVGDIASHGSLVVTGIVDGTVFLRGGQLRVLGAVRGDVVVSAPEAVARIDGVVGGTVRVHDGVAVVRGSVGSAFAEGDGLLVVESGAIVGGKRI
jgi:hypothetical protein